MAKEQSIRDPAQNVQWRAFFFPDFNDQESVMVFKCHHTISDGIGFILMTANLLDNPDIKNFPNITMRFPLWQMLLMKLLVPFMVAITCVKMLVLWVREDNAIKNPKIEERMSSLKNIGLGRDMPI